MDQSGEVEQASSEQEPILRDPIHFAEAVKQYDRMVRAVIARTLSHCKQRPTKDVVDDLTQETWLRVWRFRDSYDTHRKFSTWACQIAKNITYDYIRRYLRKPTIEDEAILENEPSDDYDALDNVIAVELSHTAARLVEEMLPPHLQEAFEDEFSGRTTRETADVRGLEKTTVLARRFKLREALLPLLPEDFQPPSRREK